VFICADYFVLDEHLGRGLVRSWTDRPAGSWYIDLEIDLLTLNLLFDFVYPTKPAHICINPPSCMAEFPP
jgi:hypothetical protein